MSARRVDVSQDAERDLDDIFDYTERTWGHEQAVHYAESITDTLDLLLAFPLLGHDRGYVASGLRSLALTHHVIVYRVFEDRVRISRVIHHREDFSDTIALTEEE